MKIAPLRVVIVDDSDIDRAEIKSALLRGSSRRYDFLEAETAKDGLELISRLHRDRWLPDYVILDFNLPDMVAFEFLAAMPRGDGQVAVPVVVVTGEQGFEAGRALLAAGALDLVGKSWLTPESLTNALENARERHALLLSLRRSEQRHREIVETTTEGVCVTDRQGLIEFTNSAFAKMLEYRSSEMVGISLSACISPVDAAAFKEQLKALIEGRSGPVRSEVRLRTKSNGEVQCSFAAMGLLDAGVVRGVLTIHTDITVQRKLQEKLQHAQKLESLGVLAGGIAHDFNNLLVAILGNAGMALSDLRPESTVRAEIEAIQTAAIRASELTKQLLAYAGRGRFVIGRIDLGRLVDEMGHLLSAVVPKNVLLRYQLAPGLPSFEGDPTQIRQVVMNLITNAADAIGDKRSGIITVSTSVIHAEQDYLADTFLDDSLVSGYYVCLEVSDTGCGMTPETRVKIFDPFFTTKFAGRGLGLAAVLGIMRAHKGAIKVYSELGRGSTFKILLPAAEGGADCLPSPAQTANDKRGSGLILVVDDEETVRAVTKRILERGGYTVVLAANGIEALAIFREKASTIRAVVLDVTMPRMGGEETFRNLRQIDPGVRVLLSSGYSEQEATSRFAGKGLAGFIEKPFKPQALLERMRAVLDEGD